MGEVLNWDEGAAGYIRGRGDRYPGGLDIEPEWAQQVMHDVDLVAFRHRAATAVFVLCHGVLGFSQSGAATAPAWRAGEAIRLRGSADRR